MARVDQGRRVRWSRVIAPLGARDAGAETLTWDGRADDDSLVPPGRYSVRVHAWPLELDAPLSAATSWVRVT